MKFLFINSCLSNGGSERVMSIIANYFARSGEDVSMILLRENNNYNYEIDTNIKCKQFYYSTKNKIIICIKRFFKLRTYIKSYSPDVIISFMWDINIFTILSCLGLKERIIISERNYPKERIKNIFIRLYRKIGENYLYRKVDKLVIQTSNVKEYYNSKVQKKCIIIPNPINNSIPEQYKGIREKTIVAAGRLTEQKNFSMLIKAFAKFNEKYPDYKLIIYGEGILREKLINETKVLKIEDSVEFPGYVTNVNEKMLKASIYVSSSDYEGISNSMLEALAMGIPTICTDCPVGGAAMAIENNKNGILIPVGDENALYNAMIKIIEDKEFAKRISIEAVKIKDRFSQEKILQMWEEII